MTERNSRDHDVQGLETIIDLAFASSEGIRETSDRKLMYVKIFGERNTGTNYLSKLCSLNFLAAVLRGDAGPLWNIATRLSRSLPSGDRLEFRQAVHDFEIRRLLHADFGWKHAAPALDVILDQPHCKRTLFILLTKHPYSWIESLYRRPYDFRWSSNSFADFIRQPFPMTSIDELSLSEPRNPLEMLRLKAQRYKRLSDSGLYVIHLRYEDLISSTHEKLELLSDYLFRRERDYVHVERDVKGSSRTKNDFLEQYSLSSAGKSLSTEDRRFIIDAVGEDIFDYFGYRI